jgi:hypothetical protein
MVMTMPGIPPTERGTSFMTTLAFQADSPFLREGRIPNLAEISNGFVKEGSSFRVMSPQGEELLRGTVEELKASPSAPPCKGDTDGDGDVDASDIREVRLDFARTDCPLM